MRLLDEIVEIAFQVWSKFEKNISRLLLFTRAQCAKWIVRIEPR